MTSISPHPPRYPTDALPDSLRKVVEEVTRNVQAPEALIAMTAIAVAATASQGLAVVQTPTERVLSLNLLQCVVAESGEGKTGVAHVLAQAVLKHDIARATAYEGAMSDYRAELARWQAVGRGLRRRLTALARENRPGGDAAAAVEQHERCKPTQSRLRQTIRRDITPRALVDALAGECESVLLLADEGNLLLQSSLMTHPALLSSIWDGIAVTVDRADGTKVLAGHPSVSLLVLPQPAALRKYLDNYGNEAVDTGLLSRCLLSYPASTQGRRFVGPVKPSHEQVDTFNGRITDLLEAYDRQITGGKVVRRTMKFTQDAASEWYKVHNFFEGTINLTEHGYLGRSFVRKASEHVARVSGIFHFIDDQDGDIPLDTVKRAIELVMYHADQFVRLTTALSDPMLLQSQANLLVLWLRRHVWNAGMPSIPKTELMHSGPWQLRSKAALNRVLPIIIDQGYVTLVPDKAKRLWVCLNPTMFQSFFATHAFV